MCKKCDLNIFEFLYVLKKNKRGNRKRPDNVKSQNAKTEQIIEGDETFQGTASVETVTNDFPSVEHFNNETECPKIREFVNGNIGDGDLHSRPVNTSIQFHSHGLTIFILYDTREYYFYRKISGDGVGRNDV